MLAAGGFVALLPNLSAPFLGAARRALASGAASLFFWSLAGVALLVLPPTVLLGAVAPFLVKLRVRRIEEVGRVSGSLSGVGTAGSLLGTFLPTLVTIPFLGTTATLRLLGALLILASTLLLGRRGVLGLAIPLAVTLAPARAAPGPGVLAERDSAYQHIRVEERPDGTRVLLVNEGIAVQSSWTPGYRLSATSYDAFVLLDAARDGGLRTLLDLGLAGGTIVHDFRTQRPRVAITGVEIDPVDSRARAAPLRPRRTEPRRGGSRRARLPRADAAAVRRRRRRRLPWAARAVLLRDPRVLRAREEPARPRGAIMMNVAVLSERDRALAGLRNTMASVFAETWVWHPEGSKNWFVVASDAPGLRERLARNPVPEDMTELRREFLLKIRPAAYDPAGRVFYGRPFADRNRHGPPLHPRPFGARNGELR